MTFHMIYIMSLCRIYFRCYSLICNSRHETPYQSLTEICGKVLSKKNAYKSVKTALLSSNVIEGDHQNSCLFTNKGHFSSPLCVLIGVPAKFHE